MEDDRGFLSSGCVLHPATFVSSPRASSNSSEASAGSASLIASPTSPEIRGLYAEIGISIFRFGLGSVVQRPYTVPRSFPKANKLFGAGGSCTTNRVVPGTS